MKDLKYCMKEFLKANLSYILFYIFILCVFAIIPFLYDSLLPPICYALEISLFVGVLFQIYKFVCFYKRHTALEKILKSDDIKIGLLKQPDNLIEKDYQKIITRLQKDIATVLAKTDMDYRNQLDYYTLWIHEIKTPIFALNLLIQTKIKDDNISAIFQQELFKIQQYVEMVLQYIRIEKISNDIKLQKYNLYQLVKEAVKKYSVVFANKDLELRFEHFDKRVLTDEKWLIFIVEQVLSNAIKYTYSGYINIFYDTESDCLVIEDTGIGISQEDIPRIFDNSFTGYNGHMDKKSSGMGLYLCKKVADQLSHTIDISSTVGKGTVVRIGFPHQKLELY